MENLNDVEFGSDKGTEEAPILIAQRYLNIYRQIHIFNKEKRDQFDDELLALPQNVTDFFKRMPGGRLLVEHIEEVKTERGISFVKSNKEDFTNGAESNVSTGTPAPAASQQAASGATVAIDASFAQTLAQSMANAFKQVPTTPQANGNAGPSSVDFSRAFELVAEEIKTSRASLLDVLQEMHMMTSSLIASQVSIARTLENLLEKPVNMRKEGSPENIQFSEKTQTTSKYEQQTRNLTAQTMDKRVSVQNNAPVLEEPNPFSTSMPRHPNKQPAELNREVAPSISTAANISDETQRKKKKKKKNKENRIPENASHAVVSGTDFQKDTRDNSFSTQEKTPSLATKSEKLAPALGGIVRDTVAKHTDTHETHSNARESATLAQENKPLHSDTSFLDAGISDFATDTLPTQSDKNDDVKFDLDDLSNLIDEETVANKPVQAPVLAEQRNNDLDFVLAEQGVAMDEEPAPQIANNNLDRIFDGDGLDFALPEQGVAMGEEPAPQTASESLNNIFDGDGLDFALPEQSTAIDEEPAPQTASEGLNNIFDGDGLDFALPEQSTAIDEEPAPQTASEGLNNIFDGDGLDFALSEQGSAIVEEPVAQTESGGLDDIFNGNNSKFVLPDINEQNVSTENFSGLDEAFTINADEAAPHAQPVTQTNLSNNKPELETSSSRYSEELDRIRAALTSDNIDISSLDQPIELDDYSDDESILNKEEDFIPVQPSSQQTTSTPIASEPSDDEEWEWEYVDENGNPVSASDDDEEWEWEYVEDDSAEASDNNSK